MLTFFTVLSALYILSWKCLLPHLTKAIKNFDPSRGTVKDNKVYYPPKSPEGRILTAVIYGTLFYVGGFITLIVCLFFWLIKVI